MENIGLSELLIILLFIFIFFGAKKIPDIAQGIGKGIREFRNAARDIDPTPGEEVSAHVPAAGRESATCFSCSAPVPNDARFCPSCGQALEPLRCAACNTANPPGTKFCSACGQKM